MLVIVLIHFFEKLVHGKTFMINTALDYPKAQLYFVYIRYRSLRGALIVLPLWIQKICGHVVLQSFWGLQWFNQICEFIHLTKAFFDELNSKLFNSKWIINVFDFKVLWERHLLTLHVVEQIIKVQVVKFWNRSSGCLVCFINFFNTTLLEWWFIWTEINCLLQLFDTDLSYKLFTKIVN